MSTSNAIPTNAALERLRQRLAAVHIHQGEPSTRVISVGLHRAISHATVSNVLRCAKLPTWGQVELVAEFLGGDIEEFRRLWIAARSESRNTAEEAVEEAAEPAEPALGISQADRTTDADTTPQQAYFADLLEGYINDLECRALVASRQGIATGFDELDTLLAPGLGPGQLVLITGCPAVGKTTLMLDIVRHASIRQDVVTLVQTLELNRQDIVQRILAAEARIPLHVLGNGKLDDQDWERLARRIGEISPAPLIISQPNSGSLTDLRSGIQLGVEEERTRLVAVDSVRQIRLHDETEHSTSRVCRVLKEIAVATGVTLIATVPRGQRLLDNGEYPSLERVRELSDELASISEDADVVIAVHRDDQYTSSSPRAGEGDFFVIKNRNGPTDVISTAAQLHLGRFVNMALEQRRVW